MGRDGKGRGGRKEEEEKGGRREGEREMGGTGDDME